MCEILLTKIQTRNSSKKETTGSKKKNIARKKVVVVEKKVVSFPIVHSEHSNEHKSAESNPKFNSKESEYVYDNINCNHRYSEEHNIIKSVTKKTSNWMQICEKITDDKIDPGPEEHKIYELLQDKITTICNENIADA